MVSLGKVTSLIFSRWNLNNPLRRIFLYNVDFSNPYSTMKSFKFSDLEIEIASQAQKQTKPDPSTLSFGETFSDHMFQVEWNDQSGWDIPRIVPLHLFQFHPGSKIFHYGQAAFEGMKAFKSSDGSVALFRPELNIKRLLASAERATLPLFDGEEFLKCLKKLVCIDKEWIPSQTFSSLYIRPTFIGTQNSLGVKSSNTALLYIVTCPVGPYFSSGPTEPVSLLADPNYIRAWPGGVGDKKMACNYAISLYVQRLAQQQGLQQVLWLFGENHQVAEVGAMNVFFVFRKGSNRFELATPVLDGTILPGVVRQSLLDLAKQYDEVEVSERTITMKEIASAVKDGTLLEMFVCGTASTLCPVNKISYLQTDINIPTMNSEIKLYQRLYKALTDIQYGRIESQWSVKIE